MDWGKGEYERTAKEIEPVSAVAIDALHPHRGELILDVACGTGNAALMAAARGAEIVGVDASERLIEVAAQRARMEAVEGEWRVADAEDLPYKDDQFDGVISVFGVIFAKDAVKAAADLKRVVKPGGTIVITAWMPTGPIAEYMKIISATVAEFTPASDVKAPFNWSDEGNLRELFGDDVEVTEHHLSFKASSAGAWVLQQAEFHPSWIEIRKVVPGERYEQMLDDITAGLTAANVDPNGFEIVSDYVIARAKG